MPLEDGAFALVEYSIRVKDGELIDTTSEEEAKKAGIYDAKERYGPRLVIVGEGRLIKGLEEAIKQLNEGEEKEVEIPPEKAFGKRDPSKIKIIPRSQFIRSGVAPEPGKVVEINGQIAIVRNVSGGRVVVDFNHPLAGKTLVAKVRVVRVLRYLEEKLLHLMLRRLPPFIGPSDVKVEYNAEKKVARYMFNEKALLVQDMQIAKRIVLAEINKYLGNEVKHVEFVESISLEKGEEKRESSETGEKAAEASTEEGSGTP